MKMTGSEVLFRDRLFTDLTVPKLNARGAATRVGTPKVLAMLGFTSNSKESGLVIGKVRKMRHLVVKLRIIFIAKSVGIHLRWSCDRTSYRELGKVLSSAGLWKGLPKSHQRSA